MPRDTIILFYSADPIKAEQQSGNPLYAYFSNFSRADFTLKGHRFYSSEQYMMWRKAQLFGDHTTAKEILETLSEEDLALDYSQWHRKMVAIKKLGRRVANFDDQIWRKKRYQIMIDGLTVKFGQDPSLRNLLLGTGHCTLAECTAKDKIWANGLSINNPNAHDPTKWQGLNLLGRSLMRVRRGLRKL